MVTLAAAVGLPHEDIAEALHVSRNTYGSKSDVQIVIVSSDQDRCDGSAPPASDSEYGLPSDAEPFLAGSNPCEEALDVDSYQASARDWHELARATSDATLHIAYTQVALAFERLAFVATRPAKAAIGRERKSRARH